MKGSCLVVSLHLRIQERIGPTATGSHLLGMVIADMGRALCRDQAMVVWMILYAISFAEQGCWATKAECAILQSDR